MNLMQSNLHGYLLSFSICHGINTRLLDGSVSKEPTCNAADVGSIPGSGRSPGGGNGYSLQYSCLEHPRDRGAWQATIHGIAKSRTRLSTLSILAYASHTVGVQ